MSYSTNLSIDWEVPPRPPRWKESDKWGQSSGGFLGDRRKTLEIGSDLWNTIMESRDSRLDTIRYLADVIATSTASLYTKPIRKESHKPHRSYYRVVCIQLLSKGLCGNLRREAYVYLSVAEEQHIKIAYRFGIAESHLTQPPPIAKSYLVQPPPTADTPVFSYFYTAAIADIISTDDSDVIVFSFPTVRADYEELPLTSIAPARLPIGGRRFSRDVVHTALRAVRTTGPQFERRVCGQCVAAAARCDTLVSYVSSTAILLALGRDIHAIIKTTHPTSKMCQRMKTSIVNVTAARAVIAYATTVYLPTCTPQSVMEAIRTISVACKLFCKVLRTALKHYQALSSSDPIRTPWENIRSDYSKFCHELQLLLDVTFF
jgi:hypothetical protein